MTKRYLLCSLLLLCLAASAAVGQTCPAPTSSMFPPPPGAFTHTAVVDGGWSTAATWGGSVPGNGAIVCIPRDRKVTVSQQETARLRFIQVNGQLKMGSTTNTRLYIDTLLVDADGIFQIGTSGVPVQTGVTAKLVFISWDGNAIDRTWDPEEKSRGLISMGTIKVYGDPKTHMVPMTANALKGSTHIVVDSAPSNWSVGDTLVLTGSYFRENASSEDELIKITAISGNAIDFAVPGSSTGLVYDHVRPRSDLHLHVANLTRNVIFSSEVPSDIHVRGHVMLMTGDDTFSNVALNDLGRTDKRIPLDDMVVQCDFGSGLGSCRAKSPATCDGDGSQTDYSITANAVGSVTNRRGRYALHFHLNGTTPGSPSPATVTGTVVNGTVGWGFVSHSSQVDFLNDVAYNFAGAGFVTEAGNELGTFDNDIAIRGTGDAEYRPNQIVFKNTCRPQPLADFAFSGDGFWFQGPAIHATNNVAAGCNGVGMIWFTTGQPDVKDLYPTGCTLLCHNHYTSFLRSTANTVYGGFSDFSSFVPRFWDTSLNDEKLVIGDLPILEMDGFEGYGNLVGFRLRFNNLNPYDDKGNLETSWYNEFQYHLHIKVPDHQTLTRMRQELKNITVWNNEYGIYPNYTSKGDWSNVTLVNRLDYDPLNPFAGARIDRQIDVPGITNSTFTNLTIDGYEVAGLAHSGTTGNPSSVTFSGQTYLNYATFDSWDMTGVCPVPSSVTVTPLSSTSVTLSWTPTAIQKRFLVRYRADGDQQWILRDTAGSSVVLPSLVTGKTYTYQVMAGCKDATGKAPSKYTAAATFSPY